MATEPAFPGTYWSSKSALTGSESGLYQILSSYYRPLLLLAVAVLMALKGPGLLLHPRIWAEEVYYLNDALTHGFWHNLIYSKPSVGYYLLTANIPIIGAAIVSKTIGLEYAPFVTTYFSFLVQLLPFAILIYGKSHLFRTRLLVAAGCFLILLAPTTSGEIWLTSIHTKSWTGLAAFVILFEDMSAWSKKRTILFRFIILFCGLSGPYAAILFPIFTLSYFVYRERERLVQASILAACCLIHLCFYVIEAHSGMTAIRNHAFSIDSAVVNVFFCQIVWAFLGEHSFAFCKEVLHLGGALQRSFAVPRSGRVLMAAGFCTAMMLTLFVIFWNRKLRSQQSLLLVSFLLFAAFTAKTALNGIPHNRYTLLPSLAVLLFILCAENSSSIAVRTLATLLLACSLYSGVRDYRKFWLEFSAGEPVWSDEVQKWKQDKSYNPVVWPIWWKGLDSYSAAHTLNWHPDVRK
jgi:hypothetical protein